MFVHFLPKPKDLLFCLQGPGKAASAQVNISRSTIPIHQMYLIERELEREAYSNLQQAGRPGPDDKRENMMGNRGKKNKTRTLQLILSFLHGMALYSDCRDSSRLITSHLDSLLIEEKRLITSIINLS